MTAQGRRTLEVAGRLALVVLATVVELLVWGGDRGLRGGGAAPVWVIPTLTLLVYATLLLRRRLPVFVFGVQWLYALTGLAVPEFQPFAGLLIALHALASRLPPRQTAPWLVTLVVPFGVHSYNTSLVAGGSFGASFATVLALWLLFSLAVWGLGRLAYSSAQRAWRLRELQFAEAAEAVTAERMRLARELHDIVSHAVTGMTLQAAGAQALLQPTDERLRRSLTVIETTGVQAMSELHRMLGLLHPDGPDAGAAPPAPGPTVADIETLVELAAAAGRDVRLSQHGTPDSLDPSVEVAAYRVVQEGLTNSSKHAGQGAVVTVDLRWDEGQLEVQVVDRRSGPAPPADRTAALSSGRGLPGLAERVALIGGSLTSGPTADGFQLLARLPRPRPSLEPRRPVADAAR